MRAPLLVCTFITLSVLVGGCAGKREKPEARGYLATQIEADGSKIFQYTLVSGMSEHDGQGRHVGMGGHMSGSSGHGMSGGLSVGSGGRSGGGSRGSGRNGESMDIGSRLETMLQEELVKTGYCRAGFTETERATRPPQIYIKGKCKDTATENDRKQFPNESD